MYFEVNCCVHIDSLLKVCFGIVLCFYHCNMEVNGYELSLDKRLNPVD